MDGDPNEIVYFEFFWGGNRRDIKRACGGKRVNCNYHEKACLCITNVLKICVHSVNHYRW